MERPSNPSFRANTESKAFHRGREGRELERNDDVETVDGREEWNNQAVVC